MEPNIVPVQQPKPQALPSRAGPSAILVSPRQKGNPILNNVRSTAWEYSDMPADYVLGATTCALFLSLKYHRLHPEYIYNRIRDLKGQYNLRILLTMVDIENHEEPLRELSKTSLINNVTVILCWSAQEAGRYLELFKSFENTAPTSIRAQQSTSYSDKLVEFITVPRSINKTDAVGLVSNFGSIRTAVNAGPEEVGLIAGWGEKKVQRWCNAVREPFRIKKTAKRGLERDDSQFTLSRGISYAEGEVRDTNGPNEDASKPSGATSSSPHPSKNITNPTSTEGSSVRPVVNDAALWEPGEDEELALLQAEAESSSSKPTTKVSTTVRATTPRKRRASEDEVSEGVMAALTRLPELHIEIFNYLIPIDLKQVRLLDRKSSGNAAPLLFRSMIACTRYQALGAFQAVSTNATLHKYVKELVFDASVYHGGIAASEQQYNDIEPRYLPDAPGNFFHRRNRFRRYKEMYNDQEEIRTSYILLHEISRVLDNCPNISTIVYCPEPRQVPKEARVVRDMIPRGLPGVGWLSFGTQKYIESTQWGIHHIIAAVHQSQYSKVREFRILPLSPGQHGTELTTFVFDFPDPQFADAGEFFFRHLHKLELNLSLHHPGGGRVDLSGSSEQSSPRAHLRNLSHLLGYATELHDLVFNICHWEPSPRKTYGHVVPCDQPLFSFLGLDQSWTNLRSISLGGVYASEQQLKNLISRHHGTLRSLRFEYCSLFNGCWANLVDEVLYNTIILPFSIKVVNEVMVGDDHFEDFLDFERKYWQYSGSVIVNGSGERHFVSSSNFWKSKRFANRLGT
ncbi:hypothetical protein BU24DRAFT_340560 [Aaosphaeria arxii CBS 175.79]|uniref:ERCC1-like central domain-containing protein n=1 Tax=Aaosphaeria arxii CBS 175.79 TaxID=1450172 RepID=A0A6A5Y0L3_9PLEO|nr:uncharacterized protein BU24DRAFT_340560 [Aaosphaeria arxii CBS 175.79]KAF2018992.1 hypothetical protein BU24DRAFT_340560 [Aaosphaeria arxii CBS 175.79]